MAQSDPLVILLENAKAIDQITYTTAEGSPAADLASSAFIHFASAKDVGLPRNTRTRVLRSRNSPVLSQTSTSTPDQPDDEAQADEFLPLDALVFLLQTQNEAMGLYTVQAIRERVARVDTLDRPTVLDFLLGAKSEVDCEMVLSISECEARIQRRASTATAPSNQASVIVGDGAASAETKGLVPETATSASVSGTALSTDSASLPAASTSEESSTLHPLLVGGKRPYVASKQDAAFVKRLRASEVVLRDRAWAFRCTKVEKHWPTKAANGNGNVGQSEDDDDDDDENDEDDASLNLEATSKGTLRSGGSKEVDFTHLRRSVTGRIAAAKSGSGGASSSSRPPAPSQTNGTTSNLGRSAKHRRLDPIIILPSSPSALLNLSNIKRLLEDGHFDASGSANGGLVHMGGSNEVVVINRPKGGRFLAVDSLEALTRLGNSRGMPAGSPDADPWRRVVCVITTGQKWQFRGYRWEEGRELFRHVFGAYARYSNQNKDENIRDWNVLDLQIDPSRRHHDAQLSAFFWRQLEAWVQRKRPDLA